MSAAPSIPVIDYADLTSVDPAAKQRAAGALEVAFGQFGLVYVRGHEIVREEVLELYEHFLRLLERSPNEKATWGGAEIWFQRGWTPPNTEQAVVAGGQPDYKECYFAAPEPLDPLCKRWFPELYVDNIWPKDAPEFEALTMAVGHKLHHLGHHLLTACELALNVPRGSLTDKAAGAAHVSRLLKYLPLTPDQVEHGQLEVAGQRRVLWGEEHTDFNVLTLLPGGAFFRGTERAQVPADAGGLYLRTRPTEEHPNGLQLPGRPPEGCVVAQVGQQLEVLTGGTFLATPHVITAPMEAGWTRTSFAHFVHLNGRERVEPLPEYREQAGATYAPPVLAGNYAVKTLVDIGLADPAVMQRLGYRQYGRLAAMRAREAKGS